MWSWKITSDDELLSAIRAILNPGAASFTRLVVAVLLFSDDSFQTLLAHRSEQVLWRSLDIICNPDSLVANNNKGLQQAAPLDQRNAGQIAILPAQQVEHVVLNPRCSSPEILQEVEIG